jgi:RNA polymerase sigma factor (sigma-70 family)
VEQIPRHGFNREDLFSAGLEGLWKAWESYDATRRCCFQVFARKKIEWAISDFKRKNGSIDRRTGHQKTRWIKTQAFGDWEAHTLDPEIVDAKDFALKAIDRLQGQPRIVIEKMLAGNTLTDIARELGCNLSNVSQLKKAAYKTLRRLYNHS